MSVTGTHGVGLPIILLHDAEGAVVTVELKDGSLYRGILDEAQDNMNCTIKDCVKTSPFGKETRIEVAYVRGAQVRFIVLPNILKKAPIFNRIKIFKQFRGKARFGGGKMEGAVPRGTTKAPKLPGSGISINQVGRGAPRGYAPGPSYSGYTPGPSGPPGYPQGYPGGGYTGGGAYSGGGYSSGPPSNYPPQNKPPNIRY